MVTHSNHMATHGMVILPWRKRSSCWSAASRPSSSRPQGLRRWPVPTRRVEADAPASSIGPEGQGGLAASWRLLSLLLENGVARSVPWHGRRTQRHCAAHGARRAVVRRRGRGGRAAHLGTPRRRVLGAGPHISGLLVGMYLEQEHVAAAAMRAGARISWLTECGGDRERMMKNPHVRPK